MKQRKLRNPPLITIRQAKELLIMEPLERMLPEAIQTAIGVRPISPAARRQIFRRFAL